MRVSISSIFKPVPAAQNYFPELTGLRAVAAGLVFIHHLPPKLTFLPDEIRATLMVENSGLIVFFTLSSFLIFYRYGSSLTTIKSFYQTYVGIRLARIYPLYFVLTVILFIWESNFNWWVWFLNLTLLKGYFQLEHFSGIGPGWSLSLQETFYLAAPVLFLGFSKFPGVTILLSFLIGGGLVVLSKLFSINSFMPSMAFMITYTPFGFILVFYAGYLLAKYVREKPSSGQKGMAITYIGLGLLMGCLYITYLFKNTVAPVPDAISVKHLLMIVVFPVCLLVFLYGLLTSRTLISRLLALQPVQLVGRGSYAFYLLHTGLYFETIYFHISKNLLVVYLILTVISIGIYYCFEKPIYWYLRQQLLAKKLPATV